MIIDELKENWHMRPFLFRFAEPIPDHATNLLRYDSQRQISQMLIAGNWIDSPDAAGKPMADTRITRVRRETTDDA